jgi:uncharacterized protein (DUF1501 family)
MLSRREFLSRTSLVSLCPLVPSLFSRIACAATTDSGGRCLVVIQLDGGNDGVNTVVPFGDDAYGRNRKALRLDAEKLHKLNEHVGLHPQMKAAKELFDDGRFTIVQGVGYPNPNRSHFESMRIWQTARLDAKDASDYGWLGRALDAEQARHKPGDPSAIYVGPEQAPIALWGRRSEAVTIANWDDVKLPFAAQQMMPASNRPPQQPAGDDLRLFTTRQLLSAYAAADHLQQKRKTAGSQPAAKVPDTQLGNHLKTISQLIQSGSAARVFYTSQGGYDTHASQLYTHAGLLRDFSEAVKALLDDLKSKGLEDRVVVLAFSEFGRRVKENDSHGTDHGAAGPVFLAGGRTIGGLIGATPDLGDLDNGDIKTSVDLRDVYAALLEDWLEVDAKSVLGGSFRKANVLRVS